MPRMVTLWKHPDTGIFYYRRSIPKALRQYFDGRWEWKQSLRTKDLDKAKQDQPAFAARCEAEFAKARAGQPPMVHGTLSDTDVLALSAKWLAEELKTRGRDLGSDGEWDGWADVLDDAAAPVSGAINDAYEDGIPDYRRMVGMVSESVDAFLKRENVQLDRASEDYERLALEVFYKHSVLVRVMRARLRGDFSPVPEVEHAPKWERLRGDPSQTVGWAFDRWNAGRKLPPKTEGEYRSILRKFDISRPLAAITRTECAEFRDTAIAEGLDLTTVNKRLEPLRRVLNWAASSGYIPSNPIEGLKVDGLSRKKREPSSRKPYTRDDARKLLLAARGEQGALRWIPWVLAATGCRLNEVCQAFAADIESEGGITYFLVTDRGKGQQLKNSHSERRVPIHPALRAEGFLEYVRSLPEGSRLFPDLEPDQHGNWSAALGRAYGRWARPMIPDKAKVAHSWRHSFKTFAVGAGILDSVSDTLTGHGRGLARRDRGEAARYEHALLQTLADAVAKIDFGAPAPEPARLQTAAE